MIKAVFGETVLSDIHASMNNIDKLRNIIMKEQKILHPHGQGVMEVVHAFNQNESNLCDYIQRICKYLNIKIFNKVISTINIIMIISSIFR